MQDSMAPAPSARALFLGTVATLGLTAAHHVYGGVLYATPWRVHGAVIAVVILPVLFALFSVYRRRPDTSLGRLAGGVLAVLTLVIPVLSVGLFEGLYNHVLKNILFLSGAPASALLRLFPPPTYEVPSDAAFEVSGVAQVIPAAFTAMALLRFVRARGESARRHGVASSIGGERGVEPRGSRRVLPGAVLRERELTTITGAVVRVPDAGQLVHLQFRRFAGCPVCNLHLHSLVQRQDEIAAAGIREIVVFHSTAKELLLHTADLPFDVIADPEQRLYADFGVESAPRALLDPRAWGPVARAVARSVVAIVRGQGRAPSTNPLGGRLGLPADLLIASNGRVLASKYGRHVYDQWSVDELLELARAAIPDRALVGARTL